MKIPTIKKNSYSYIALLILAFLGAIVLRFLVGGDNVRSSVLAGITFGTVLLALSLAVGIKFNVTRKAIIIGIVGGLALCVPIIIRADSIGSHTPAGHYWLWMAVVAFVAGAEEMFLRGVLYDAIKSKWNEIGAILSVAAFFALLHLPLYGFDSIPLDFAVGCFLGSLRAVTKSVTAPLITHVIADGLAWWII